MSLALLGYLTVIVFLIVISSKKLSPLVSIIAVPIIFSLIGGFGMETFSFAMDGIKSVAKTFSMILFAILYFSLMVSVGLFDPMVKTVLSKVKGDPVKIMVGASLMAAIVSCGGDGSTTFLVTCTAMVPIFDKMKMNKLYLACVVIMQNTILNLLPWGGPMARVVSVLNVDAGQLTAMMGPGMVLGILYSIGIAWFLGTKERKRLGISKEGFDVSSLLVETSPEEEALKRPKLFWINLVITIATVGLLLMDLMPSAMCFVVGTVIALTINFPDLKEQRMVIGSFAAEIMNVVIMVVGAGVLMGILNGTGMSDAIGQSLVALMPESMSKYFGVVIAFISAPGTVALSNDAFYYGVMPVLANTAMSYGFTELQIAFASMIGQAFHQLSPLVAAIYLLVEMTGTTLDKYQRFCFPWKCGLFIIYLVCGLLSGNLILG
jgi:citrate-Mg2+:H+ or citrate-Ca2+:H+ symporter, CitMHS family